MTDAETAAAVKALAHRLRQRDEAMRNGEEYADAEPFALEYVTAMLGNGWRHLDALAKPKPAPAESEPGSGSSRRAELLAPVRAQLDELNAAKRTTLEEGAA